MVDFLPLKGPGPDAGVGVGTLGVSSPCARVGAGAGASDGQLGVLKSRFISAFESLEGSVGVGLGSNLLAGLQDMSSRLEAALTLSQDSPPGSPSPPPSGSVPAPRSAQSPQEDRLRASQASGSAGAGAGAGRPSMGQRDESRQTLQSGSTDSHSRPKLPQACGPDPYDKLKYKPEASSSSSNSEADGYGPSTSIDSPDHDAKYWVRSGSEGSVKSWASSLSLDSQSDESTTVAVEFMRQYVSDLFTNPADISLEQKAKFGQLAQTEAGRLWFSRFVNAQRVSSKRVDESTFYSLVQHFAIVLFECADADDFGPAKSLMNMCFTFYHEVGVPGCEPYKEYLSVYLREQPIWHSLRFWNAALFDALQCERVHKPPVTRDEVREGKLEALANEQQYQENITFGQLGTFTCNMHAFGMSRELCTEFLRKQCVIANLRDDQEKMLRDNVERMYSETDPWRSQ